MQTPTEVLNIGADIAKDNIVVACSVGSFPTRTLSNQRTALLAFLKSLPAGSRIGMESTGTYHELFAMLAHKMGFVVFVLNPKDTFVNRVLAMKSSHHAGSASRSASCCGR